MLKFCEYDSGRVWIQGLELFGLELISSSKQPSNKIALSMFGSKSYLALKHLFSIIGVLLPLLLWWAPSEIAQIIILWVRQFFEMDYLQIAKTQPSCLWILGYFKLFQVKSSSSPWIQTRPLVWTRIKKVRIVKEICFARQVRKI